EDAQGTFTLTPAPAGAFGSQIAGVVALTATPASVVVNQPVVETATLNAVTPVVADVTEGGTVDTTVSETTLTTPVAVSEESEQAVIQIAAESVMAHVNA